jgi:hypothetical protein
MTSAQETMVIGVSLVLISVYAILHQSELAVRLFGCGMTLNGPGTPCMLTVPGTEGKVEVVGYLGIFIGACFLISGFKTKG